MRAGLNEETRFERAVEQVKELAEETLKREDGIITVILAEENASFLVRRSGIEHRNDILEQLDALVEGESLQCSYGHSDIDGAMDLAQEVVDDNPEAEVILYTAPVVGLWSPPTRNAPFVCIEPWYGRCDRVDYTGEYKDRDWVWHLEPGELFDASYTIEIAGA